MNIILSRVIPNALRLQIHRVGVLRLTKVLDGVVPVGISTASDVTANKTNPQITVDVTVLACLLVDQFGRGEISANGTRDVAPLGQALTVERVIAEDCQHSFHCLVHSLQTDWTCWQLGQSLGGERSSLRLFGVLDACDVCQIDLAIRLEHAVRRAVHEAKKSIGTVARLELYENEILARFAFDRVENSNEYDSVRERRDEAKQIGAREARRNCFDQYTFVLVG